MRIKDLTLGILVLSSLALIPAGFIGCTENEQEEAQDTMERSLNEAGEAAEKAAEETEEAAEKAAEETRETYEEATN